VLYEACAVALIFAGFALAAEHSQPATMSSVNEIPSASSQEQTPSQRMPPDHEAQPSEKLSTPEVQQLIKDELRSEPALANASLSVKVDDNSVWLTGTVDDEKRHDLALRIAESYSGKRQIVDKIKVTRRT
jgi:osmotically-inducible protein OsmY